MISSSAAAQQSHGILADGNAVATGFSGALPPPLVAPGADPAAKTFIDVNGPAARVIDLQEPGAAPQDQLIAAAKPFTVSAGQLGQVFAVTIDDAVPPNVYVAATSAYGLPIVVPDQDGDGQPDRVEQGAPNARFMTGLFGPQAQQGGPGSIWRLDGATGAVSLFANVTLEGVPNGGPALGGIAFDAASKSLFVADRETGMIHRIDLTGAERGRYDHGTQGRQSAGLPPVPFEQATRLTITSPRFQAGNTATWGYAPLARRIFGVAVRGGRLYYAVAEGLQVWSVAIAPDGAFGTDVRREFAVPPQQVASEISKIAFDDQDRMVLAERVESSGEFDFGALINAGGGRVLRLEPTGGTGQRWRPATGDAELGLDASRRVNGGVAIGYGYDTAFRRDPANCGSTVWWTGEELALGGPDAVNGLQGRIGRDAPSWLIDFDDRLDDAKTRGHMGDVVVFRTCPPGGAAPPGGPAPSPPPGDVPAEPRPPGTELPPLIEPPPPTEDGFWPGPWGPWPAGPWPDGGPPPPPPVCPPGTHLEQGNPTNGPRQCCPVVGGVTLVPGANGGCVSKCANGSLVPKDNLTCELGFQPGHNPGGGLTYPILGAAGLPMICWNGQPPTKINPAIPGNLAANNKCPKPPIAQCRAGFQLQYATPTNPATAAWLWSNATCVPTPAQQGCAPGQQVGANGTCQNLCPGSTPQNPQVAFPVNRCCQNGTAANALGQCNPGIMVSPNWSIGFAAGGTFWCIPGVSCSYYEFTITGQQRFGRGSLVQRITLPSEAAMEGRIVRGSRYCPVSAWSCSRAGNVLTCSAGQCGLAPGDQVVLRIEGNVAPDLRAPPSVEIVRTACGVLEWQAMSGPGVPTIEDVRDVGRVTAPPQQPADGVGTDRFSRITARQVCWTIRIPPQRRTEPATPSCPPNYLPTADNQCCLASQMTVDGQCCPIGQRPDPRRQTCVSFTPPTFVPPGVTLTTPCGPDSVRLPSGQCCPRYQMTAHGVCCPPGTTVDARRRTCVRSERPESPAVTPPPCPTGWTRVGPRCVPPTAMPCPNGWSRVGARCVPPATARPCPSGWSRIGGRCVPPAAARPCPSGWHRVGTRCVPSLQERQCGPDQTRVGGRCVTIKRPVRPERPYVDRYRPQPTPTEPSRPRPRQ